MDRITLPPESIRRRIEALSGVSGEARWTPAAGGLSTASVWRLDGLDGGQAPLAIRCWGVEADGRRLGRIAHTLQRVHRAGLHAVAAPIGEPLHDRATGAWERAPWRRGVPLDDCAEEPTAIANAVSGLAKFHELARAEPAEALPCLTIEDRIARLKRPTPPIERSAREAWPELSDLGRLLPAAAARAVGAVLAVEWTATPSQVIHGDARPEHFLIEGGELTGLIDFGALRRDTPWADLARLTGELGPESHERVLSSYEEASRQPVDRAAVAAIDLAGAALSAANWARWLSEPGREWLEPERVRERLRSIAKRLVVA